MTRCWDWCSSDDETNPGRRRGDPENSDRVFVEVSAYNSKVFYVMGEVKQEGSFPGRGTKPCWMRLHLAGGLALRGRQRSSETAPAIRAPVSRSGAPGRLRRDHVGTGPHDQLPDLARRPPGRASPQQCGQFGSRASSRHRGTPPERLPPLHQIPPTLGETSTSSGPTRSRFLAVRMSRMLSRSTTASLESKECSTRS